MENNNIEYVGLGGNADHHETRLELREESPPISSNGKSWTRIAKLIALCIAVTVAPVIEWGQNRFNAMELSIIVFASLATFPVICLPSTPSIWIAGMAFGYGNGFLLVMSGVAIGVSLPYLVGSFLRNKIKGLLEKHPHEASILRLAGEGNRFHQFQAITLIRISPFPYIIFNYAVVATDVKYAPYLFGTLVGMIPEVVVTLYRFFNILLSPSRNIDFLGIVIRSFTEAAEDRKAQSGQMLLNIVGLCGTAFTTIFIGIYTKRRLDQKQKEQLILK
ncbi:hypothetical protein SLEP1_g24031 [Rubroshorea leprosula]|uniref:VTT domain-containing protein n=1 Tax=Rubroshorea leprosula TaxID=152421 RepID=A0AAV5JNL3_9ROSI|nr:hypothetical protein SLEP1_g24031 [Rubroshorea leprosula]